MVSGSHPGRDGALKLSRAECAVLASGLAGAAFAALFGVTSLWTTRFHFVANLLYYLAWEVPFSSAAGPRYLTIGYYALSLLHDADPTSAGVTGIEAGWYAALPLLAAATVL